MKQLIIIISLSCISCSNKLDGIFVGPSEMGIKHISSSKLVIENKQFEMTYNTTSLETNIPSGMIFSYKGHISKNKNSIKLVTKKTSSSHVIYGRPKAESQSASPNKITQLSERNRDEYRSSRQTAYQPIDTVTSALRVPDKINTFILEVIDYPNSIYLVNDKNCFIKYITTNLQKEKDMNNYCDTLLTNQNLHPLDQIK